MLVLTRKSGQSIALSDGVVVTVLSCGPGRVRIGIEAPRWLSIARQEVHQPTATAAAAVPKKG